MESNTKYKILIVDDSAINRSILRDILEEKFSILEATDGVEAIKMVKKYTTEISLVLLDLVMPNMDGLEVLAAMNNSDWIDDIPVIMISSETSPSYIERAYELGATDFITRPFNVFVVRKRVANTIMLYSKQKNLISLVSQQIFEKEKNSNLMVNILSHIVEFRNGESGLHILHVNTITEALLRRLVKITDKYKLTNQNIEAIVTASSLHDIGKISIPDEILNKPGRLTPEEFEIMKGHSKAGADMLDSLNDYLDEPLVVYARDICMYHHERYDGRGYPEGLVGDDIPISAQVVSIADVYDALTSERCYKAAIPHKEAIRMIRAGECGCFNPILLQCLEEISDLIEKELKINSSASAKKIQEVKAMTDEVLRQSNFSIANSTINHLEQERIKFEFFASMSQEIQFEYTISPSILSMSEWSANEFGLAQITVNPLKNERVLEILSEDDALKVIEEHIFKTTPEDPITQFVIKLNINGTPKYHRAFCRANWNSDGEPKIIGCIGKIVNIEEEHQKMLKLSKKASIDILTNIYNHGHSEMLVKELLETANDRHYALALFDVDDFKTANDTYGHMFGDRVLKEIASTLVSCTRNDDIVARIGGDEFLLFIEYNEDDVFRKVITRIHNTLNSLKCDKFDVHLSMGVASTEQVGYDYNTLFNSADSALYYSKRMQKGICTFYDSSLEHSNKTITPIEN